MKTIEEIAKQFTDELFTDEDLTNNNIQNAKDDFYTTFLAFGRYLMSLPLCDRLTSEEKSRITKIYADCQKYLSSNIKHRLGAYDVCKTLEAIFDTAMFAQKGGSHD